ncbi:MAG: ATP-binding cassette domain-containing protein [Candidatus Marinimicrobia bacterium]|jgi:cell division transport system ATP-binding protein|nr:ATP-binding cassette domain-containing protein [Candidatus Neomarinimicrobiota bacterium]|tara:strand:+ start:2727 stop:3392 length:666 start_codon:yes stop_codon:yes gene_type:complete
MISFQNVSLQYEADAGIYDINFQVNPSEFAFLIGPTGAGKSTILKLIYMELFPDSGTVDILKYSSKKIKKRKISFLRRKIGMIFQDYRLLKDRNIFENIALPLHVMGYGRKEVYERVNNVIIDVGLNGKEKRKPNELSGGEQQKACIARALVKEPKIILADEPSANLDPDAAGDLLELLKDIHSRGTLVLMATHQWQHFYFDLIKDWDYRIFNIENGYMVQ